MKNLRTRFERFCFRNRDKGIPNLMLYIVLTTAAVYLFTMMTNNTALYEILYFDRALILQGQVWRLFTYAFTDFRRNILMMALMLMVDFSLGRAIENTWGTFKFNLFYLSGIVLMDVYCLIFGGNADVYYLNLTLFLCYATMYPQAQFLLYFVIPVKAWILTLIYLFMTLIGVLDQGLFPLVALGNYFLFFGKEVINVFPLSWQANFKRATRQAKKAAAPKKDQPKVVPFPSAGSYEATVAKPKAPYTHRCTICGRTDTEFPDLEFRYCSRCKGYHCYCEDHISNHAHIE